MERKDKIKMLKDIQAGRSVMKVENSILIKVGSGSYQNKKGKLFSENQIKKFFINPLLLDLETEEQRQLIFNVG
jgi:hypothetical protein